MFVQKSQRTGFGNVRGHGLNNVVQFQGVLSSYGGTAEMARWLGTAGTLVGIKVAASFGSYIGSEGRLWYTGIG